MAKILRIVGIVLGVLVGILLVAAAVIYLVSEGTVNKKYDAPAVAIKASTDAAVLARGKYLVTVVDGCTDCHGSNLGGAIFIDDPALGRVVALNLTAGQNGIGQTFTDADYARVLRYGVKPDGTSVKIMPADDYTHLSDTDLSAVIGYIRSLPPVDSALPATEFRTMGRILVATGKLPIFIAARIDFSAPHVADMTPDTTAVYGQYMANIAGCTGCHGAGLSGGPIPGAPPSFPPAANLTPSGQLKDWTEAQFIQTIRTGVDPSGHPLLTQMPWKRFGGMSDDELKAIWAFVHTVPARTPGTR
jgi:mono/diheme cytochrome c family protein